MKKLYKIVVGSFLGVFAITFSIVVFILLTQTMLSYIEDFAGRGIELKYFLELMFYFSFNTFPKAIPLAILLASLMTYGNLGEHNELTAIKSAGISLIRILIPNFIVVSFIGVGLYFFNNFALPVANSQAYSLLWDMRHKKPSLEFKEGVFYNGLPGYSVKIGGIDEDGEHIKDVIIYDHSGRRGNTSHIVADSGRMYSMSNDYYLVIELYSGIRNSEQGEGNIFNSKGFVRAEFEKLKMVIDLSSFKLNRTPQDNFSRSRYMLNEWELKEVADSMATLEAAAVLELKRNIKGFFKYGFVTARADTNSTVLMSEFYDKSGVPKDKDKVIYALAVNQARSLKGFLFRKKEDIINWNEDWAKYGIEMWRKYVDAFSCILMFLIGAPIGAVLKKGGLGFPALITIAYFIVFYVTSMTFEKYSRVGAFHYTIGAWASTVILLPFGFYFLYKARKDASLFDFSGLKTFFRS